MHAGNEWMNIFPNPCNGEESHHHLKGMMKSEQQQSHTSYPLIVSVRDLFSFKRTSREPPTTRQVGQKTDKMYEYFYLWAVHDGCLLIFTEQKYFSASNLSSSGYYHVGSRTANFLSLKGVSSSLLKFLGGIFTPSSLIWMKYLDFECNVHSFSQQIKCKNQWLWCSLGLYCADANVCLQVEKNKL